MFWIVDRWLIANDADVRQVTVLLPVIQPVADVELVLDREADVLDLDSILRRDGLLSRHAVRRVRGERARRMSCR